MEIIVGIASALIGLLITTFSVKLAAGWLEAENSGWGSALGALLLSYLALIVLGVLMGIGGAALPGILALVAVLACVLAMIIVPILVFARRLGTTKLRATGILVVSVVVNAAFSIGISLLLATVLGLGAGGFAGIAALTGLMSGVEERGAEQPAIEMVAGAEHEVEPRVALKRVETTVATLCACRDDACLEAVFPGLMDELGEVTMNEAVTGNAMHNRRLEALIERIDVCSQLDQATVLAADASEDMSAGMQDSATQVAEPTQPAAAKPAATGSATTEPVSMAPTVADRSAEEFSATEPVAEKAAPTDAVPVEPAPATPLASTPPPASSAASVATAAAATLLATPAPHAEAHKPGQYYVLRVIGADQAAQHLRKLVRVTLSDGSRFSDQLVAVENGAAVLKRDRAAGGGQYPVELTEIERLEVFGR